MVQAEGAGTVTRHQVGLAIGCQQVVDLEMEVLPLESACTVDVRRGESGPGDAMTGDCKEVLEDDLP